jgi:hypothetical protein
MPPPARHCLLSFALMFAAPTVSAADPPAETRDRGLPESVRRIERETGGQVLRAERLRGSEVNRVKVLTPEGRVRVVHDDPRRAREEARRRGDDDGH